MREQITPERARTFISTSSFGSTATAEVESLEWLFNRRVACHQHILGSERGDGAHHGPALWRLTLSPCLTVGHELTRGVVCDPCAKWLQRSLRKYVSREQDVHWFCPRCAKTADVVRDHRLVRL